jgi:hypothetical protein
MTRLKRHFINLERVKGRQRYHRRLYRSEVLEMRIKEVRRKRREDKKKRAK